MDQQAEGISLFLCISREARARPVKPRPISGQWPPQHELHPAILCLASEARDLFIVFTYNTFIYGKISITSPMSVFWTSNSIGSAPEWSCCRRLEQFYHTKTNTASVWYERDIFTHEPKVLSSSQTCGTCTNNITYVKQATPSFAVLRFERLGQPYPVDLGLDATSRSIFSIAFALEHLGETMHQGAGDRSRRSFHQWLEYFYSDLFSDFIFRCEPFCISPRLKNLLRWFITSFCFLYVGWTHQTSVEVRQYTAIGASSASSRDTRFDVVTTLHSASCQFCSFCFAYQWRCYFTL